MRITSRLRGGQSGQNTSTKLIFVPLVIAVLMGALAMPRAVPPREYPVPTIDAAALAKEMADEHALAEEARAHLLDADVRALGGAIRQFNAAQVRDDVTAGARYKADIATKLRLAVAGGARPILALRAVQTEDFLTEVARFEQTGARTLELDELGGTFLDAMARVGWVRGSLGDPRPRKVILDLAERRAAFKQTWNKVAGVAERPEFALSRDDARALYAFYLRNPHAPESQRNALAMARTTTKDVATCERIDEGERVATMGWAVTKMRELAAIDPSYPLDYARGIALFHAHDYGAAVQAFRGWLEAHPDGPWTLRARNYLLASEDAQNAP
jgi:hypothetical protein